MVGGPEIICAVGRALYAVHWQAPLARDIGVSDRLVRFWAAGEREIPASTLPKLAALLRARGDTVSETIALLESYINEAK